MAEAVPSAAASGGCPVDKAGHQFFLIPTDDEDALHDCISAVPMFIDRRQLNS